MNASNETPPTCQGERGVCVRTYSARNQKGDGNGVDRCDRDVDAQRPSAGISGGAWAW